ncbi:MAG: oligosaccharide flippase family protein [Cyclobacteriaceae bacterium]|nr:oligosaccharide flippase family protein [Cyclobacteriaceae bacterium]
MIKKLVSHSFIYGIGPQIPKFAGLLIYPIISQDLTPRDFGLYGIVIAYAQAFLYLKTLGTEVVLSNSFFKHPNTYRLYWRHINGMLHVWAFLLSIFLAGIILVALKDDPYGTEVAVLNALPLFLFSTTENLFFRYYQLQQKPVPITVRVVVTGLINIVLTFVTIHTLKLGYRGWFYASFGASLVGFLWMIYPLYIKVNFTPILSLRWKFLKRTLSISLPVLPHFYGNYLLGTSDRVVMDVINVEAQEIGRYNAANIFSNYAMIVATATRKAVGPMLQLLYSRNEWNKAKLLVFYWQIAFLAGTTFLCIWLKEIVPFFIRTKGIGELHGMAIWIVMAVNYIPMYGGANSQLYFMERTKELWKRAFVAFAVNIVLNLTLIPIYGVYVAAINTFVAYMFLGYSSYFLPVYRQKKKMQLYPWMWLSLTLACTLLSLVVGELSWIYKTAVSLALVGVLLFFVLRFFHIMRAKTRKPTW